MYCDICDKITFNKNSYDIIHKKLICNKCIEAHNIDEDVDLVTLEALMPIEDQVRVSVYPFLLRVLAGVFFCFRLIPMMINSSWYDANDIFQSFFMFIVILSLSKIIKLLENVSVKS